MNENEANLNWRSSAFWDSWQKKAKNSQALEQQCERIEKPTAVSSMEANPQWSDPMKCEKAENSKACSFFTALNQTMSVIL